MSRLLQAELRKLLTLPALRLTAGSTVAAGALLTWLVAAAAERGAAPDDGAPGPLWFAQAGFLVLGVLAAASEHQGGDQIRTTLAAMPRRWPLFGAKLLALAVTVLPVSAVTAAVGTRAGGSVGPVGATAYLTLTALVGFAAAACLRRAETALVVLLTGYFVLEPVLRGRAAGRWLPGAGLAEASAGAGLVTALWVAAALGVTGVVFGRRDA